MRNTALAVAKRMPTWLAGKAKMKRPLKKPRVDGKILLKMILNKMESCVLDSCGSG